MLSIYPRSKQGLKHVSPAFGTHKIDEVSLHHSAGPRAFTRSKVIALAQSYDRRHEDLYGCGFAYHLHIDGYGRLYAGRPKAWVGAHTAKNNTGCYGIMVHGNYDGVHTLNARQKATLKRLYRGEVDGLEFLGQVPWRGHKEFPFNSTRCPGTIMSFLRWLRSRPR